MKKVFLKLLLLLTILVGIKLTANLLVPSNQLSNLLDFESENITTKQANILFIGSSRIKTAIIPSIIDSIFAEQQLLSYNMGIDHFTLPYSSAWIIDHLKDHPQIETVVIELSQMGIKILDIKDWWTFSQRGIHSDMSREFKLRALKDLSSIMTEDLISPLANVNILINPSVAKKHSIDGYSPYPREKRHDFKLLNLNKVDDITHAALSFNSNPYPSFLSTSFFAAIDQIEFVCSELGVELIFIAPPFFPSSDERNHYQLLSNYVRDRGLPIIYNKNEELYDPKYRYDGYHFNRAGAAPFSKEIGEQLIKLIRTD